MDINIDIKIGMDYRLLKSRACHNIYEKKFQNNDEDWGNLKMRRDEE